MNDQRTSNYLFTCDAHAPEGLKVLEFSTRPIAAECRVCGAEATRWYTSDRSVLKALLKDRAAHEPPSDLGAVYDAFQIGSQVRTMSTLLANVQNAIRRSNCLSAIEREFFTRTEKDDDGEDMEECDLSWGVDPEEYVEQFRQALGKRATQQPLSEPVSMEREPLDIIMRYKSERTTISQAVAEIVRYAQHARASQPPGHDSDRLSFDIEALERRIAEDDRRWRERCAVIGILKHGLT